MTDQPSPLATLQERELYLRARIRAKQTVGWEYDYDEREQQALAWAIALLSAMQRA